MKRHPVPKPTDISAYFFRQLIDADGDVPTIRGDNLRSLEVKKAVATVLSNSFVPEEVSILLQGCAPKERRCAEVLEAMLDESWKRVEEIIERNKERRRIIEYELPQAVATASGYTYWTEESAGKLYNLPVASDFVTWDDKDKESDGCKTWGAGAGASDFDEAVASERANNNDQTDSCLQMGDLLRGSAEDKPKIVKAEGALCAAPLMTSGPSSSSLQSNSAPKVRGIHGAKALRMSGKDLIDESKTLHCLRRAFAPILRQRDQLPKSLTLLLNAIQEVQSNKFPAIESVIEMSLFPMPFHRSFRCISSFFMRHLTSEPENIEREQSFISMYKPVDEELWMARKKLSELIETSSDHTDRDTKTDFIYRTLLDELRKRKLLHDTCQNGLKVVSEEAEAWLGGIEEALNACDEKSLELLSSIEQGAAAYMAELSATAERRKAASAEIQSSYKSDFDRLRSSLEGKLYRAKKSEEIESLLLQQLQSSHEQLLESMGKRMSLLGEEANIKFVSDAVEKAKEARSHLIEQCRQHVKRLKTDEHYRRSRIVCCARDNALLWSRCLNDLASLYEGRFDRLRDKCGASLQLRYLLVYEKDQVARDLEETQREMRYLDDKWSEVVQLLEEFEMPVPPLLQIESDSACRELREKLCMLVAERLVHGEVSHIAPKLTCAQRLSFKENGDEGGETASPSAAAASATA
uniref:Uncharacterized protein n=1 Tax=Trypanosoma vivax (strain Y486) TaxID=1055687 RepID=G0U208_TRYVY|nr:conserved hypothetical protein, fragment [Trypanosoma vivax Y486]